MSEQIESERGLIDECLNAMPLGREFGLVELFGAHWSGIASRHDPRVFGKKFKAAVGSGVITGVEWVRIENSGRFDVYVRPPPDA